MLANRWQGVRFELPPVSVAYLGGGQGFADVGTAIRRTTPRHRDDV
jgi:hypothetical protein